MFKCVNIIGTNSPEGKITQFEFYADKLLLYLKKKIHLTQLDF